MVGGTRAKANTDHGFARACQYIVMAAGEEEDLTKGDRQDDNNKDAL